MIGMLLPGNSAVPTWLENRRRENIRIVAPDLWIAEAASAVRKMVFARQLTHSEGIEALEALFALGVETLPLTIELCRDALQWAARLTQIRIYDSLYLALAEQLGAELWTVDARLAHRARQVGAPWVRLLGEAEGAEAS